MKKQKKEKKLERRNEKQWERQIQWKKHEVSLTTLFYSLSAGKRAGEKEGGRRSEIRKNAGVCRKDKIPAKTPKNSLQETHRKGKNWA